MDEAKTTTLFGFSFLNFRSEEEAAWYLLENPAPGQKWPVVCTPNAAQLVAFEEYPELRAFFQQSAFVLPDGNPLVWLSRLIHKPLAARISGSGVFPHLWHLLMLRKEKVLLVVSRTEIQEKLEAEFPDCHFLVAPNFTSKAMVQEWTPILENEVNQNSIRHVFIGLGFPKQEWLCQRFLQRHPESKTLFFLFGAAFEFYCGLKKRAPISWQKAGLEWLYRFGQEPGRLWHRYTVVNFRFIVLFSMEWWRQSFKK